MLEQDQVTGMVLLAAPVGEYDLRVVLLTKEKGRITAFARGARRQNSPFLAGTRPFSFGQFSLYSGKTAYTLASVSIRNYFTELSTDLERTYYGFYFLELSEYFGREGVDAGETVNLLYLSFKALVNQSIPNPLVRAVFELRTLVINGIYPDVFHCASCKSTANLCQFDFGRDGVLCGSCAGKGENRMALSQSALYALQFVISQPIASLYTFSLTPEVLLEVAEFLERFMKRHIHKSFHSLEELQTILSTLQIPE